MNRFLLNFFNSSRNQIIKHSKCNVSEIFRHKTNPSSFEDTLQFWIINTFRTDDKYISFKVDENISADGDFNTISNQHLLNYWLHTDKKNGYLDTFKVERAIVSRIKKAELSEILAVLDASLRFYKHKITYSDIYKVSLSRFLHLAKSNLAQPHQHKLQCLFFCSLLKKNTLTKKIIALFLNQLEGEFTNLSNIELAILSISLFKCSFKPPANLSDVLVERLKTELNWFLKNSSLLICFIKSLRIAEIYDDNLFDLLIMNSEMISDMDLVCKIHLLVYFSGSLHSDVKFVSDLIKSIANDLNSTHQRNDLVRYKDIDNFLWSSCNYWQHINLDPFNLPSRIEEIIKTDRIYLSQIFNTLYFMWILNMRNSYLLDYLNKNNILQVKKMNYFKDLSRLSILITCVSIEEPESLTKDILELRESRLQPKIQVYFKKRSGIEAVLKLFLKNQSYLGLVDVEFSFPVNCLFVGSVTCIYKGNQISIELCDSVTSYRNSVQPNGIMALKLRLLRRLNIKYYLIEEEINGESEKRILCSFKKWLKEIN